MSNIALFEKSKSLIESQEVSFAALAKIHGAVSFAREASFALQALKANDYLLKIASENPESLKQAIINIAAIGLTLSPVHKYAYLVPRDGKVMLDLSYKGMSQIAIEAKSVKYVQAEVVYSKDKFVIKGRGQEPLHERNPFDSDRGEIVGAYCIAQTYAGDFIVDTMTAKEIYNIRDRSQAYRSFKAGKAKTCPWVTDEGEMFKKTVIRRGSKSWPMTDTRESERFAKAIDVYDQVENIDFTQAPQIEAPKAEESDFKITSIRELLTKLGRPEDKFLKYVCATNKREIKSLEEMSQVEKDQALVILTSLTKPKEKVKNENPS